MRLALLIWVLCALRPLVAAASEDGVPTFTRNVAPILYGSCVVCHRPGQIAPMSLISYEAARPWSRAIKRKVTTREMPPWYANAATSMRFRNDRRLTQREVDTIAAWVDGGSPKGEDADLPPAPSFAEGWSHPEGEPDVVISIPFAFEIPAEGQVPIQNFYVAEPFREDLWAEAVEIRPGNHLVVHHSGVYAVELQPGSRIEAGRLVRPPRDEGRRQTAFALDRVKLIGQAAGKGFDRHQPGSAKRITAGRHVHFNVHYQVTGRPETDRTQVGVSVAKVPVTREVIANRFSSATMIAEGKELTLGASGPDPIPNIPAYAEEWKITRVNPILADITLTALSPHMHLRGRAMTILVVRPDGREEIILDVPVFDFNWQLHYELGEPLAIQAGSKIVAVARYDNSLKNRYNPAPWREVYSGISILPVPDGTVIHPTAAARTKFWSSHNRPAPETVTQPALTCDRLEPLFSGHFSDTGPHLRRFFA